MATGSATSCFGTDTGKLAVWELNGNHVDVNASVNSLPAGWHVDGTGDFGNDGKTDILMHNDSGQVAVWQMDGNHVTSSTTIGSVGSDWHVAGIGDYNGDGKADVLWENSKGQVAEWQMDGNHIAANTTVSSIGTDWHVAGIGDFNGDGKADVLWENSKGQGRGVADGRQPYCFQHHCQFDRKPIGKPPASATSMATARPTCSGRIRRARSRCGR